MVATELARSVGEANRLIKQGAVSVGGCDPRCEFFKTGKCTCGGWSKATSPTQEIAGQSIKVGNGFYRCLPRLNGPGFDQLDGIIKIP